MRGNRDEQKVLQAVEAMYQDYTIRDREYYPDFRRGWDQVLKKALHSETSYLPQDAGALRGLRQQVGEIGRAACRERV